ncbi:tape measure protein [Sphingobium sp. WW5]|uniref:tape measure protein n=1 Tax=unclassified Sphingobium TaxID=2611147 RepID=UPI003C1FF32E
MAVTADRVVVELEARLDRYEANVARAEAKFDKAMSGIQKSAGVTEAFVSRAAGIMSSALAGVSVIALTRQFLTLADEAKKLDATLKLATQGFGSFGQAQKDVNRIANDTRSGLSETASLYANFVRGAKELGGTQAEAARATETFSKTLKISGADANQAASATLQFGQALAAGALRGDELNSILEASPRLARLLAESMGQPIGQIKQLGEEGKLTSDKLLKALTDRKFTAGIDAEFGELPVTFDDAMTRVYNAALTTFSAFDRGGEFSQAIADFFVDGADGFADLERSAEDFGIAVRGTLEGLGDAFDPLIEAGAEAFRLLGIDLSHFTADGRKELSELLGLADDLLNIGPSIANRFGANGRFDSNLQRDFLASANASDRRRQGEAAERLFRALTGGTDALGNPLPGTPAAGRGRAPASAGASDADKKKRLSEERRAAREAEKAAREAYQNAQEDRQTQIDILRAKSALTDDLEARAQFEREMLDIERQQRLAEIAQNKTLSDQQRQARIDVINRLYGSSGQGDEIIVDGGGLLPRAVMRDLQKRLEDAANMQAEAQYDIAHDALAWQERMAGTREERQKVQLELLNLEYEERRRQLEFQQKNATSQAERDAFQTRIDALGGQMANDRASIERDNEGPLARYRRRMDETSTQDQVEELITQELDYVRDGIRDSITKRLGVKDPFLAGLIDIFINKNIIEPFLNSMRRTGESGGTFGNILTSISTFFQGSAGGGETGTGVGFASGGTATLGGRGGTDRNTLSLNGRPIANVTRGETLSVGSKAIRAGGGNQPTVYAPQFNLPNAVVTTELYAEMARISRDSSARAAGAAYAQSQQSMPGTLNKFTQLKGG